MQRPRTVGVYGFDASSPLDSLSRGGSACCSMCDSRGIRATEYAWANSQRLQTWLVAAGIAYRHDRERAPTTELRELPPYAEDARQGVGKRTRRELAASYVGCCTAEILTTLECSSRADAGLCPLSRMAVRR